MSKRATKNGSSRAGWLVEARTTIRDCKAIRVPDLVTRDFTVRHESLESTLLAALAVVHRCIEVEERLKHGRFWSKEVLRLLSEARGELEEVGTGVVAIRIEFSAGGHE